MKSYKRFLKLLSEASDKKKEFLAKKYPNVSAEDINHWEKHVPDKHLETAVRFQHNGSIRAEDFPRVQKVLSDHETIRHPEYNKDLNRYKKLSDIEDAHDKYLGRAVNTAKAESLLNHPGATLLHNSNGYTVHKLNTEQAAKDFGKGTKWCTGSEQNNMFDHYSDNLMVIHTPKGEKYQIHHGSEQLMDIKDHPVKPDELVKKHPELKNVKELKDLSYFGKYFYHPHELHAELGKVNLNSEHKHRVMAAEHPEHAGRFLHDDYFVRAEVAKHKEYAGKLINDHDEEVRIEVAKHPEHAGKMIKDPESRVRGTVAGHKELAHHFIKDDSSAVREVVAGHKELAHHFINDPSSYVREVVAGHKELAGKLINDQDSNVRRYVAKHVEHAGKLINDPNPYVRTVAAQHPEHAGKLINDPNPYVRATVAAHPEHAGKLVNDDDYMVQKAVASHREHAGNYIKDINFSLRAKAAEWPEHAKHMIDDPDPTIRNIVAMHKEHAPHLLKDGNRYVRDEARKTLGIVDRI